MSAPTPLPSDHLDPHDPVLLRLRSARPDVDDDVAALLAEDGDALLAAVFAGHGPETSTAEQQPAPRLRPRLRRAPLKRAPRSRRTLAMALALAAVTATGVVLAAEALRPAPSGSMAVSPPSSSSPVLSEGEGTVPVTTDTRAAATAPAGAVLLELASVALAQPGATTGGQVVYTDTTSQVRVGQNGELLGTQRSQLWWAPDGAGKEILTSTGGDLSNGTTTWRAGERPEGEQQTVLDELGGPAGVPTDPTALARQVAGAAATMPLMVGNDGEGTVTDTEMRLLTGLLRSPQLSAEQRSTVFTAMAARSDVGLLGEHTDPQGRTGTAIEFTLHNGGVWRETLTFDPQRAVLLAWESTLVDRGTMAESLARIPLGPWTSEVYSATGMVADVGDIPAH
ncbi:hypothetical protein SAMN06264364_12171 [Quadrisphaera granulorum]|uniref:Uncharacterized protein n=1 Tax=Quadrisphaera granulorum TaxID=317664 RepID=A0A316A398_9ACTN|nr:hypothetical protein [Quadrisphaera granulorum]PWJ51194.1 hypothetical protein BXY45_12171 [Quadrisphaera granulorum]SZE97844.1 hypothetical protein SAMN06264364_12171 [Quadrisphaera granulorum]